MIDALKPEYSCSPVEIVSSLAEAFQRHLEQEFRLCFIFQGFDAEHSVFFRDIKALGRDKTCHFILVTETERFEPISRDLIELGFSGQISLGVTKSDKQTIWELFERERQLEVIKERCLDMTETVRAALRTVDTAAKHLKRGRFKRVDQVLKTFIRGSTKLDESVMESYLKALQLQSDEAQPFKNLHLKVSESWKERLPEMEDDGYKGVSNRTWERLRKRWGKPTCE
jgi:hypothetical protein